MRLASIIGAAAVSLVAASPSLAATFINVGNQAYGTFNGTVPGTSASLLLTLTGENNALNTFTFSYVLTNTSPLAQHPTSRIQGFGFNDNVGTTPTGSASGDFDEIEFNHNFPDGLGNREICVHKQNCLGGNGGVVFGDPGTGSFTLDYTGSGLTQINLTDFAVHYISLGANGSGSGSGILTEGPVPRQVDPVPEPATWAMMLVGFGFIGFAMRRRRQRQMVNYNFA